MALPTGVVDDASTPSSFTFLYPVVLKVHVLHPWSSLPLLFIFFGVLYVSLLGDLHPTLLRVLLRRTYRVFPVVDCLVWGG